MATVARSSTGTLAIETDAPEYLQCDTHCEGLFKRLRDRQDLCDVVLIIGDSGKRISAHRLALIGSSDYFSALLSGSMRESQEREITLYGVDGDALEKLVNFCYTGKLKLQLETIEALLSTANYLQFNEVFESGCEFLIRHLQSSNCLDLTFLAQRLNLEALLHTAEKIICENFEDISKDPNILLLNAKQLSPLIASDDLFVPSEEFVFNFVMKWIDYELDNRKKHFKELLDHVRLALLPPTFLTEVVEPFCSTMESKDILVQNLKVPSLPKSNSTKPRKSTLPEYLSSSILGIYIANNNLAIAAYNLYTNEWTRWNTPVEHRDEFAVALMDDNMIVVGGFSNAAPSHRVTSLHLPTMVSTEMAPLRTGRRGHCVAVLNGFIYAIGGNGFDDQRHSVERWDPATRTWNFVAPMNNFHQLASVAIINDHLYVSAGHSGAEFSTLVECYDPVTNTWRSVAPLKVGRLEHSLVAHNGYLFAIGGTKENYDDNESEEYFDIVYTPYIPTERYDPHTDTWTSVSCSSAISNEVIISDDTRCVSLGPNLYIYNDHKFYISSEGSCDNLKLQMLSAPDELSLFCFRALLAISYKVSPPGNWINEF